MGRPSLRDHWAVMTMYTQLLETALDGAGPDEQMSAGESLAALLRAAGRLGSLPQSSGAGAGWVPAAVVDQLAYDMALVRLSRCLGIDCDIAGFDRPERERARLKEALASRGVHLDELDGRPESVASGS